MKFRITIRVPIGVICLALIVCLAATADPTSLSSAIGATPTPPAKSSEKAITPMEFCLVGDVSNPPDKTTKSGSVGYRYEIGKYEVTNAHYCQFLNAVASTSDPYGLFSVNMERGFLGGIRRVAKEGRSFYEPLDGYANLPVNYVSWYNAARFCNWLHYTKGRSGKPESGTTEGDGERGAYDTRDFDRNPRGKQRVQKRNLGARYWIPSLDEWNKAAFYDPTKDGAGGYWLYPTRSDAKPAAVPPGDAINSANYYDRKWAAPDPFLTPAGGYRKSASYYGTFDQAGNVWEWTETVKPESNHRRVRGGACTSYANTLVRTNTDSEYGDHRLYCFGFRVCRDPGSIVTQSP
jgi:formylglycine-generating enzyme